MRLKGGLLRVGRGIVVAIAVFFLFQWLQPQGLGWLVWVLVGVGAALWVGWRTLRIRRARADDARADRWATALMSPPERPGVARELREAIAALDEGKPKQLAERAHLSLVLAELLEADGDPEGALEVLEALPEAKLEERMGAVVRHARAVSHLSAGRPEAAREVLDELPGPCGDRSVDLRVRMLRGIIAAETGDPEEALEVAEHTRDEAGDDADLKTEARLLKAVALDAAGDRADALKVMHVLGDEMLDVLAILGLPRVRALATETIAQRAEED